MMRKMYVLASALLFMGGAFAQQKDASFNNLESLPVKADESVKIVNGSTNGASTNRSPEDIVFTEDFANGLDGNNELNEPWVASGQDAALWRHDFAGPQDQWSVGTGSIESATADNGYMLFTPAEMNQEILAGGGDWVNASGWIQSPELDLSDLSSVLVDFEIYYRYCCFGPSPVNIGVSIDDGVSWQNFNAYNYSQFIEDANEASGTLLVTTDISSVAANQSSVLIRFSYNDPISDLVNGQGQNFGFYYMGVDDVVVYENPNANNLSILQVMNGDVDALWELKNTPLEQTAELTLGAVYGNFGSASQTGVVVTWDIMQGDNIVHTSTAELGEVSTSRLDASGSVVQNIDTAWVNTGYTLPALGTYTIRTTITANEEEEVPETSTMDRVVEVTIDVMSHDDLELLDIQLGPRDADDGEGFLFEEVGFGTRFFVFNPGSVAYGLQVVFGDNTTIGTSVLIEFYEVDPNTGINVPGFLNMPSDVPLTENDFEITEADLGVPVFFPFLDPIDLEVGKTYLAAVRQFEGDEELWVRATSKTDTDNSSYVRERGGSGDMVWFSRPDELAVRLGFSETTTVNEIAKQDLKMVVAPNPANDFTNVSYELKEAKKVSYTLYDLNGRTILSEELGSQASGVHKLKINTSSYDTGVYYLIMTVGESTVSEKIVISK